MNTSYYENEHDDISVQNNTNLQTVDRTETATKKVSSTESPYIQDYITKMSSTKSTTKDHIIENVTNYRLEETKGIYYRLPYIRIGQHYKQK